LGDKDIYRPLTHYRSLLDRTHKSYLEPIKFTG